MYNNVYTPVQHMRQQPVNPGGLCWLIYALWEDVAQWPEVHPQTGLCHTAIKLKPGKTWYDCKVVDRGRIFTEDGKVSNAGSYWEHRVTGYWGGNTSQHTLSAGTMKYHQYVVMFKDRDGQVRFIGNADAGADIEFGYTSADLSGSRKRTVVFTWEHENPAPIYIGSLAGIVNDTITPPFAGQGDFSDDFSEDFNI